MVLTLQRPPAACYPSCATSASLLFASCSSRPAPRLICSTSQQLRIHALIPAHSPAVSRARSHQWQHNRRRVAAPSAASAGAASTLPPDDASKKEEGWGETLVLGALFAGWYAANIAFNIYNKQALKVFPHPLTCTAIQFAIGSILSLSFWQLGLVKRPQITASMVRSIIPLAVVHTLGNVLTNISLGAVAVSFTHTIKAMEPFFSVLLSSLFLGETPHPLVLATLLPIVGGVALASMSEASFNWLGFLSAMGSNLTFQSRNVLSKKLMLRSPPAPAATAPHSAAAASQPAMAAALQPAPLDNVSLFSMITLLSAIVLLPVAVAMEGLTLTPAALQAVGILDPAPLLMRLGAAGACFHLYQQISYLILQRVSPVTHSVGNCVKRIVVIAASVLVFKNPVSQQNAVGTGIALLGVFAYSQVKRLKK